MLDDKVLQDLKDTQARLSAEGKLPSRTQLVAYYDTFRRRFGPERLSSLDGAGAPPLSQPGLTGSVLTEGWCCRPYSQFICT